jgi:hypothetical protein
MVTHQIAVAPRAPEVAVSLARLRTARMMSSLAVIFLLFDGFARMVAFAPYLEGTLRAGYTARHGLWIGLLLVVCALLYAVPRTAVLGAVLLTGYLGAATATNLRIGDPIIFPLLMGVWIWAAIYLVDPRLARLLPLRRSQEE